jgi:F1F0 ATPase subunit 2
MSEPLSLTLHLGMTLLAGFVLGVFFYAGLWWTTRRVIVDAWSPLWFIASFVFRMAVTITGFYLVAVPDWKNILMCLLGFLIARLIVSLTLQRTFTNDQQLPQTKSRHHAP